MPTKALGGVAVGSGLTWLLLRAYNKHQKKKKSHPSNFDTGESDANIAAAAAAYDDAMGTGTFSAPWWEKTAKQSLSASLSLLSLSLFYDAYRARGHLEKDRLSNSTQKTVRPLSPVTRRPHFNNHPRQTIPRQTIPRRHDLPEEISSPGRREADIYVKLLKKSLKDRHDIKKRIASLKQQKPFINPSEWNNTYQPIINKYERLLKPWADRYFASKETFKGAKQANVYRKIIPALKTLCEAQAEYPELVSEFGEKNYKNELKRYQEELFNLYQNRIKATTFLLPSSPSFKISLITVVQEKIEFDLLSPLRQDAIRAEFIMAYCNIVQVEFTTIDQRSLDEIVRKVADLVSQIQDQPLKDRTAFFYRKVRDLAAKARSRRNQPPPRRNQPPPRRNQPPPRRTQPDSQTVTQAWRAIAQAVNLDQINPSAEKDVAKVYRKAVRLIHPDKNTGRETQAKEATGLLNKLYKATGPLSSAELAKITTFIALVK